MTTGALCDNINSTQVSRLKVMQAPKKNPGHAVFSLFAVFSKGLVVPKGTRLLGAELQSSAPPQRLQDRVCCLPTWLQLSQSCRYPL